MPGRGSLRSLGGTAQGGATRALAVALTIQFACVCVGCSWYMILVKSRMVRDSKKSVLTSLEACSIFFACVAHTALIHYILTRRPSPILMRLAQVCVTALGKGRRDSMAQKRNDDDTEREEDAFVPNARSVAGVGGELRGRSPAAMAAPADANATTSGEKGKGQPGRRGYSPTKTLGGEKRCRWRFGVIYAAPLFILVGVHWMVHRTIEEKHRQSQEIVLALVRCSTDAIVVILFTTWCAVSVLRTTSSHSPRLQRVWNYTRGVVMGSTVLGLCVFAAVTVRTIYSIDPIPHLRTCILDDHECDPCEAEGLQLNPMLRLSWVWPAITPRRLFTFYSGSEKCRSRHWRPIAYLDEPTETLVVSSLCSDGTKPHIYLHRPENSELHGRDDFFIVEVRAGNKQYHRDLESWYGTEEKARAAGVTVHRDRETKGILSVELTPSLLKPRAREPTTEAERAARVRWPSNEVLEVPLGDSATYIVRCPATDHEEYFVFPMTSKYQVKGNETEEAAAEEACLDDNADLDELAKHEPAGNVLVLLFDAVSRQSVRRTLPRFAAWMQDFHRRHRGGGADGHFVVEPLAQTTLGISTAGNMAPQLTGFTNEALGRSGDNEADLTNSSLFNIAKAKFADALHTTMTVGYCHDFFDIILGCKEPSSGHGGPFRGVDHYLYEPMCHLEYSGLQSNFQGPYSIIRRCIANRHVHEYLFNYTEYILKRQMRQQSKIAKRRRATSKRCAGKLEPGEFFFDFTYFVDGHEGTHTAITLVDEGLVEFMDRLEKEIHFFDNPLNTLILTADHGNHMGHYFEFTYAGRFERTTPATLYVIHPEVLRRIDLRKGRVPGEAMANFLTRSRRVVTPLDFYLTLGDLLGVDGTPFEGYKKAKVAPASMFDARSGPPVHQCRDFSSRLEFYICAYHYCTAKEDAAAAVRAIGDF